MALSDRKRLTPHKHLASDIINSAFYPTSIKGGSSSTFNGGTITLPFELEVEMPHLDESLGELKDWMFLAPENLPDPVSFIRFKDVNETGNYTDLYGVIVSNGVDEAPAIACNHHIVGRKDLNVRGMLASYEGIVALNGGYAGWAPTDNPMVWLREGGMYGTNDALEIRVVSGVEEGSFVWGWGSLACDDVLSYGGLIQFIDTDVLIYRPTTGTDANKHSIRVQTPVDGAFIVEQTLACNTLLSSVATGTAPIALNSETLCTHLNADLFDGHHWADIPSAQWTAGAVASVTTPLAISGTALIIGQASTSTNGYLSSTDWNTFNGKYGSGASPTFSGLTISGGGYSTGIGINVSHVLEIDTLSVNIDQALQVGAGLSVTGVIGATGQISTSIATGTAPLSVSSTTVCANLNADKLDGHDWSEIPSAQWTAGVVSSVTSPLSIVANALVVDLSSVGDADTLDGNHWSDIPALQWTAGAVSAVDAPLSIGGTGGTRLLIGAASTSTNGYLSSTDWNTFNGKYGSGASPTFSTVTAESYIGTYGVSNNIFYVQSSMLAVDWGNWLGWTDSHFTRANVGVISVVDEDGDLASLNTSNLFVDHINSASSAGITLMDDLVPYDSGVHLGAALTPFDNAYLRIIYSYDTHVENTIVFDTAKLYNSATGVIQVQDSDGDLATLDASNIFTDHINSASSGGITIMDHLKMYSALNILPDSNSSGNIGGDGTGTSYYWASVWAGYLRYKNVPSVFDHLDDLALVKNYKIKTETKINPSTKQPYSESVVDIASSLPHLLDSEGFLDPSRDMGFMLGCTKALAIKQDENEARFNALLNEIDALKEELQAFKKSG